MTSDDEGEGESVPVLVGVGWVFGGGLEGSSSCRRRGRCRCRWNVVLGSNLPRFATIQRSHATAAAVVHPYLSQMDPLVFGQYADECLYLTKLVMIFGPLRCSLNCSCTCGRPAKVGAPCICGRPVAPSWCTPWTHCEERPSDRGDLQLRSSQIAA